VKKEVRRYLSKTKLPGRYDRLVKLISQLYDPIGGAHADRKKTGPYHNGVQTPGVNVMGKIGQQNMAGFSKSSESVYGRKFGLSRPR
jgi:hypothetical protein